MRGRQRRAFAACLTLALIGLTFLGLQMVRNRLGDESTFTGWTLLAATASLYLLTIRKKLIRLKLGPVAGWLQMHTYAGTFASLVFLMHIGWPVSGWFESALAAVFVIVAVSGIVLGIMSRRTPHRLAAIPVDHHRDRIPILQAMVARDAHEVALRSAEFGEGATLSEYYQRRLLPFFRSSRSVFYHLVPNGIRRRQLLRELTDLERYLASKGISSRDALVGMVKSKDDLDYHLALQTRLQTLFAIHFSLTWALALMIGVHVVLVFRFQGAM